MKLNLTNLTLSYQKNIVLSDISYSFGKNEIHMILGPNGSGKSTLLKAISGVKEYSSGTIWYSDKNEDIDFKTLDSKERAKRVSVVPQSSYLGGSLTVEEVVSLGRTPYISFTGKHSQSDNEIIQKTISILDLQEFSDKPISMLSGGEQQRVLVARALVQDTPIILLDEPTNHLDLRYQSDILNQIKRINNNSDKIIIIAMHDLNTAINYANNVVLLKNNRIFASGNPKDVLTEQNINHVYQTKVEVISSNNRNIIMPKN